MTQRTKEENVLLNYDYDLSRHLSVLIGINVLV